MAGHEPARILAEARPSRRQTLCWPGWDTAGLPWRATRAELAARFGVRTDNPYQWELVSLDVQPLPFHGMLWPLGFQALKHFNLGMPLERLSTHIWVADDADTNIGHAGAQLARVLGPQPIVDRYNTRRAEWG